MQIIMLQAYGNLNGDGFGIGWFSQHQECKPTDPSPCVFTSVTPAWNNENLGRLSCKIVSPLVFAHVRAAYPGMPVSEQNCHPFQFSRYLWMHNGVIGGFMKIRRALLSTLADAAYDTVSSFHSDSAISFSVFLNHLPDLESQQSPQVLLQAMEVSLLNFVVSDGHNMIATRYVSHDGESPASLYYAEGSAFQREPQGGGVRPDSATPSAASNAVSARNTAVTGEGQYSLKYGEVGTRVAIVSSEPITGSSDWVSVPRNTALVISQGKNGYVSILKSPLASSGKHPRQEEVMRCLEAVTSAAEVEGQALAFNRHKRRRIAQSHGSLVELEESSCTGASALGAGADDSSAALATSEEHLLTGHSGAVVCLALYEDYLLFSGSTDCTIKVWHTGQCKCVHTLRGHKQPVQRIAICGGRLYSTAGRNIRVWDVATFECLQVIKTQQDCGALLAMTAAPDGTVYVGGQDMRVQAFRCSTNDSSLAATLSQDAPPSHQTRPQPHHGKPPHGSSSDWVSRTAALTASIPHRPACNSDPTNAAPSLPANIFTSDTALQDGTDRQGAAAPLPHTRAASPAEGGALIGSSAMADSHCGVVVALALCGGYVCSAGGDAMIKVWKADSLEFVRVLRGHRGSVLSLCSLGGLLLSGGRDNIIRVWDMDALVCRRTLAGHRDDVMCIAGLGLEPPPGASADPSQPRDTGCSQFGEGTLSSAALFASSSADGSVRVWSARCWSCLALLTCQGPDHPLPFLTTLMSTKFAVTGSSDKLVRLWSIEQVYKQAAEATWGLRDTPHLTPADSAQSSHTAAVAEDGQEVSQGTPLPCQGVAVPSKRLCTNSTDGRTSATAGGNGGGGGGSLSARLEKELERTLREFVRMKTVSSDPSLREDCFRGAKYLAHLLESLGAEIKISRPVEDKNPVVIARLGRDKKKRTVTFYGHYDVQPAMEREWTTDPFEMNAIDGYFYGRGTSDNKGPILAFIYAVKEMLEEGQGPHGSLPVNVAFVFEGEEENGSVGFKDALLGNQHWLEGTQLVVISNTQWVGETMPCLTYGMRGMIALSIEVKGPERDIHSGNDGGVFNEPLSDLTKLLASLVDSRNNIMVPGFYLGVRPNTLGAALQRLDKCHEFSLEGYREALGIPKLASAANMREVLKARWCEPTLSVVDVRIGDEDGSGDSAYRFGPTRFSVIPRSAVGNVSIRFVPDQNADVLIAALRAHIEHEFNKLRSSNTVSVRVKSVGDWWEADPESKLFRLAERALAREWNVQPLFVREGGTMPVASTLEKMLAAPALLVPFGQASDNCHLANERLQRINLIKGKNVIKHLLNEVATV
ncbi:hypothetical protein ABBQ32_007500 [Trebouxia sp. C0010 RCD-2024]